MWTWFTEHYGVVSALASMATLCVWVLYLQLFYRSYRHQLQPKILITRGGGHGITARCMLTNMSPEIVFIQAIVVRLTVEDRVLVCSLSDSDRVSRQGRDPRSELFQGPMSSGEYLDLGSFEELAEAALQHCDGGASAGPAPTDLSVTAVGTYTWDDRMVAAERSFRVVDRNGNRILHADQPTARQIRSRRELKRITKILEEQSSRPNR